MSSRLSEATALDLLRAHCSVLRRRLVFDASREDGALVKQAWMSLLCLHVSDNDLAAGLGYELRVAIDIVNALCACSGFSPERNHRFWRTTVAELWIEYTDDADDPRRIRCEECLFQPPSHMMLPFDSVAFSCFSIDFQEYPASGFEPTLVELWRQVTWTNANTRCPVWILERRRVVLDQLLGNKAWIWRPVRTLQLELLVPTNVPEVPTSTNDYRPELVAYDWQVLRLALEDLGTQRSVVDATPATPELLGNDATGARRADDRAASKQELSIAFHPFSVHCFYLHSSNLAAMTQLLCGCRAVKCVTLDVQLAPEADASEQTRLFGELLRALLVETKTLKTLRLIKWVTKRVIAAVGSMVPVASRLESLLISGVHAENTTLAHVWAWLEYGLSHPLRRDGSFPELMLSVDETSPEDAVTQVNVDAARRSEHPLKLAVCEEVAAALARAGVSDASYEWFAMGTTVARVVVPSTSVHWDPSMRGRPMAIATASASAEFEAVVRVVQLGVVGVVVRGCGLGWVSNGAVTVESTRSARKTVRHSSRGARLFGVTAASVCDWSVPGNPGPSGLPIVQWLDGEQIRSLALAGLDKIRYPKFDVLTLVLHQCPNLTTLLLERCGIASLQPLVDAYASSSRPCQITSLSVVAGLATRFTHRTKCRPLLKMLSNPRHAGARLLQHLSLAINASVSRLPMDFRVYDFARMLAKNAVLETVFLSIQQRDMLKQRQWTERTRVLLEPMQDQVLDDCGRVGVGLLSVVSYYGRDGRTAAPGKHARVRKRACRTKSYSALGSLDAMVVRHILAFVGPTRVRCMRWSCEEDYTFPSFAVDRKYRHI